MYTVFRLCHKDILEKALTRYDEVAGCKLQVERLRELKMKVIV